MKITGHNSQVWLVLTLISICLLAACVVSLPTKAINQLPIPEPIPGSYGLAATKTQEAPTSAATITTPANGGTFSQSLITIGGMCTTDLLVQIYDNSVMVGSVMCTNNSFSLQVSLFAGTNEFVAVMYDDLEQAGPSSNIVTVTYNDATITAFGQLITLTSAYGRRSAASHAQLSWPLQLTGGTGPYAFSIDWGDGSKPELKSQALAGVVSIAHTYTKAGIYQVNILATDVNGVSAFLQVIAVASGKVEGGGVSTGQTNATTAPPQSAQAWIPAIMSLVLLLPTFWLGRRSQIVALRHKMLKERDAYNEE